MTVGNLPSSIVVGDFNEDGNLDFAVSNENSSTVSVMRGDGSGKNFNLHPPLMSRMDPARRQSSTADLNGDGHLDLVVAESNNGRVDIYKGKGDGTFTLQGTANYREYAHGTRRGGLQLGRQRRQSR